MVIRSTQWPLAPAQLALLELVDDEVLQVVVRPAAEERRRLEHLDGFVGSGQWRRPPRRRCRRF